MNGSKRNSISPRKPVSEIQAQLTSDLTNVLSWLYANFLILNLEKTKIVLVVTHQRTAEADDLVIQISNRRLERVNTFKYPGVLLDNTLSWKDHIEYIGNKISPRLGVLRRARVLLVFHPNYAQIMPVFQNSATFFQYYARKKMGKTVRKVSLINLLC